VIILGFPASSTQVTRTTGVGKSIVVGGRLFRPISLLLIESIGLLLREL
jgi:hypothetical protein